MQLSQQMFSEALTGLRLADLSKSESDRRRYTRFVVQAKLAAWPGGDCQAEPMSVLSRDISMEGVGLLWAGAPAQEFEFTLALPREKKSPRLVVCAVKHARALAQGLWGVGAQFVRVIDEHPAHMEAKNKKTAAPVTAGSPPEASA